MSHGGRRMSAYRTTAIAIGVLFLLSYAGFTTGTALVFPSLDPSRDLAAIGADEGQLIAGTLLLFVNMAAIVGIAALLFPVMRPHGEGVALWYIGFRILEATAFLVGSVGVLSLVSVSEASGAAEASSAPVYEGLRSLALAVNVTAGFQPLALLYAPIALNELFLAGWLLVRGFNAPAVRQEPAFRAGT